MRWRKLWPVKGQIRMAEAPDLTQIIAAAILPPALPELVLTGAATLYPDLWAIVESDPAAQ